MRPSAPDEHEGGHNQCAHRVSKPPRPPGPAIRSRRNHATPPTAGDPDGSANQRAQTRRQDDQSQDILQSIQGWMEPDHMPQEEGTQQRFKRIAYGDPTGGECGGTSPEIDRQGANRDAGPEARALQCQSSQGDAGRWPHYRCDTAHSIKRQSQGSRADIRHTCDAWSPLGRLLANRTGSSAPSGRSRVRSRKINQFVLVAEQHSNPSEIWAETASPAP
jgi:hypothetical protein